MHISALLVVFLTLLMPCHGFAAETQDEAKSASGLPLPRFAALRADEVNMRTGPGTRYPIEWVFVRQYMPVEITAEFDIWRRIKDFEGSEGWVHKSALTGKRAAIVRDGLHNLYKSDSESSPLVARVEAGTIGLISACSADWCVIKFDGTKGYMRKEGFWGTYPHEIFD